LLYKAGQWTIEKQARYTVVFPLAIVMVTLLGNRWLTRKQSIESTTHVNRAELYADVTSFLADALLNSAERSEDEQTDFIVTKARELTPRLIAYASNDVLKKWTEVTNFGAELTHPEGELYLKTHAGDSIEFTYGFRVQNLIVCMRKDLGYASKDNDNTVLKCFINDIP